MRTGQPWSTALLWPIIDLFHCAAKAHDVAKGFHCDNYVLPSPTSPFRSAESVQQGVLSSGAIILVTAAVIVLAVESFEHTDTQYLKQLDSSSKDDG